MAKLQPLIQNKVHKKVFLHGTNLAKYKVCKNILICQPNSPWPEMVEVLLY